MNITKIGFFLYMITYPILGICQKDRPFGNNVRFNDKCTTLLSMKLIPQIQSNWCYAACTEMVLRHFGDSTTTQCQIVENLRGLQNCCKNSSCLPKEHAASSCDSTLPAGFNTQWINYFRGKGFGNTSIRAINYDSIKKNLDACMPVIALFNAGNGRSEPSTHAVVIIGYLEEPSQKKQKASTWFVVLDPAAQCIGCTYLIEYNKDNNRFIAHNSGGKGIFAANNPPSNGKRNSRIKVLLLKR